MSCHTFFWHVNSQALVKNGRHMSRSVFVTKFLDVLREELIEGDRVAANVLLKGFIDSRLERDPILLQSRAHNLSEYAFLGQLIMHNRSYNREHRCLNCREDSLT